MQLSYFIVTEFLGDHLQNSLPYSISLPVCDVGTLWPNGWTIKMKHGMQVCLGPGHTVLVRDPAPPTIFGPCPLWPNGWMD